ncbi:ATP-binding cassette domain-containing protein [Psychrobacillus sp. OK032]|uniref:ATP-binding cassette domain-containing protein n=1 Tax=Psychrobacillus sp. OK032 TaxID=1884358 RepID=UPI002100C867|nr:ATP-binding cassette domain-containing protein [Psychrobacillus sp. OK032]
MNYSLRMALRNVSCTIEEGKWISIIGQTGAGKSTFVQVLKGLIANIDGDYLIDQYPVKRDAKGQLMVIPEIGFVFQYPEHQLFETTVFKELSFAPKQLGLSSTQITERISKILPQLGLTEDILPLAPFQLSGGLKRRVAIASVLMMEPKLLIVDEPTAGLDPVSKAALLQLLKKWQQQENRTIIFVSHQMEDVAEYSDEVMVFHEGHLMGQLDTCTLFLEQSHLLEKIGLSLPESVQFLKIVEELSGEKIKVSSCREQEIFEKVLPLWRARGLQNV